jgi:hypothetical protein
MKSYRLERISRSAEVSAAVVVPASIMLPGLSRFRSLFSCLLFFTSSLLVDSTTFFVISFYLVAEVGEKTGDDSQKQLKRQPSI